MNLKITAIHWPGFKAVGVREGRRKTPIYPNTAWIVFDKNKCPHDHRLYSHHDEACILAHYSSWEECNDFISNLRATEGP